VLSAEQQPVVGGQDDLGGRAHGAALGEVATDGAALLVGDREVEVAAILRQGAGERDDLQGALPGGVLGAAGEPQPGLDRLPTQVSTQPARTPSRAASAASSALRSAPGRSRTAIVCMPRGYRP
jgi:hypothetical protein